MAHFPRTPYPLTWWCLGWLVGGVCLTRTRSRRVALVCVFANCWVLYFLACNILDEIGKLGDFMSGLIETFLNYVLDRLLNVCIYSGSRRVKWRDF